VVKIFKNAALDEITFEAAEQRPAVAHGETVGFSTANSSSPGTGRKKCSTQMKPMMSKSTRPKTKKPT